MKGTVMAVLLVSAGFLLVGCLSDGEAREETAKGYTIGDLAQGPPPDGPVPDVVGVSFQEACRTLQRRGYLVSYSPVSPTGDGPVSVASQSPEGGEPGPTIAERRGVVEVKLSGAPARSAFTPEGPYYFYDEVTLDE